MDTEILTVQCPVYSSLAALLIQPSPRLIGTSALQSLGLPLTLGLLVHFQVVELLVARSFHVSDRQLAVRCLLVDPTKPGKTLNILT